MNEIVKVNPQQIAATMESVQGVFDWNQRNHDKGLTRGRAILDTIEAEGMTQALFDEAGEYLALAAKCRKMMNEKRAPVTQIMDAFRANFTTLENDYDANKADTIPGRIKAARDQYAARMHAEAEARRAEAARAAQAETMKAQYAEAVRVELGRSAEKVMQYPLQRLAELRDALTLENYERMHQYVDEMRTVVDQNEVCRGVFVPKGTLTQDEADNIRRDVLAQHLPQVMSLCHQRLEDARLNMLDLMPQMREALEKAQTDAVAAQALKEQIAQKQAEDAMRAETERKAAEAQAAAEAAMKAQQAQQAQLFEAAATVTPSIGTKSRLTLEVSDTMAWPAVFNFWWLNEGQTLDAEQLEKTLGKFRRFAEKLANGKVVQQLLADGLTWKKEVTAK